MLLRHVFNVVGLLQVFIAFAMFGTAGVSFLYRDGDTLAFILSGLITLVIAGGTYLLTRNPKDKEDLTSREGFAIVSLSWAAVAVFGGLPYLLAGVLDSPWAAIFEAMSGFTTTGATVFSDIESLPHGILFWRSLTHWIGGMGIIVLVIAVLPFLGVGGMQLFRAEVPGPTPERLRPRIAQTAKLLWLVYVGLTAAEVVLFLIGGMGPFDAINHAFATLATGGFSTKNASIAAYDSAYIHWVTILFMYLAGINFSLHFRAASGKPIYFKDPEWRFFTFVLLSSALVIMALNLISGRHQALEPALRDSLFQAASITTTTGFVSADYELWVPGAQMVLFALFFVGGMAGSTGGGIKTMRIQLLLKQTANEIRKHLHPRAILLTRLGRHAVSQDVVANVVGFVILYLLLCLVGAMALGVMGLDPLTAIGGSIATVGNVGPGFGDLGATDNYGWLSGPALALMTFLMLVGRLEIYTVLLLFHRETWKARKSFH